MAFREVLKCETCGKEISWGDGAMEQAEAHERDATMIDPEFRVHWVQLTQIPE